MPLKNPYFDVQAEMGISKHIGGAKATDELMGLCHIAKDSYVLEIGCGSGMATNYIAKKFGCRIMGIDISSRMVDRARENTRGIEKGRVEFRVADAQKLPFKDETFDAVISESVTAFMQDKAVALSEYKRVLKKGGYIGLNETTWIKKPTKELSDYFIKAVGGVKPESKEKWKQLLEEAGMKEIFAESRKLKTMKQISGEMQLIGFTQFFKIFYRFVKLYITSSACRKVMHGMMKDSLKIPKNLLDYFGYGIYVGRK